MFSSKYLDQINEIQRYQLASIVQSMTASMKTVSEWNSILTSASNGLRGALSENVLEQYQQMMQPISESVQLIRYFHEYEHLITSFQPLDGILSNYNSDDSSNMESTKNEEINNKVITEIFQPDSEKAIDNKESPIITLSPVNDQVLKYLSEHPESFYQLTDNDFEIVMAEIYSKLGYDVTRTKATRDGGKDLIIRIPEILGDFIYYVECKKYNPKRPIGIGIIRSFVGTVNTDRVNSGILATTSFLREMHIILFQIISGIVK